MSDFFARLAGRAADLPVAAPMVRPRLPHLFERPQPMSAESLDVEGFRSRTPEPPPTTEQRTERGRPPAPRPPALATPLRPVQEPHVDDVVRHRTVTNVESVSSVRQVVERLLLTQAPTLVPPPLVAPTRIAPDSKPADRPPAAPPPPTRARAAETSRRTVAMPVERADLAAARSRSPEPERVVHISIGRLEVLGNRPTPRKPGSRTERPAPLLPLNDYLTGEGGRG